MGDALNFLSDDFNQASQQMRHYDKNIMDSFKLVFTIYIAVLGTTTSFLDTQLMNDKTLLFQVTLIMMYCFVFAISLFILGTRKYFVKSARYLNEIRAIFFKELKQNHIFLNKTGYFTDYNRPKLWHWKSSHSILFTILFLFNQFGGVLCLYLFELEHWIIAISIVFLSCMQVLLFRNKLLGKAALNEKE